MGIRRTKHAVFDLKYHLVWIPKYRRHVLVGEVARYTKEVLQQIAAEYEFTNRHDGSNGRPCSRVSGGSTEVFAGESSSDYEEHIGARSIQEIPEVEGQVLVWRVVE